MFRDLRKAPHRLRAVRRAHTARSSRSPPRRSSRRSSNSRRFSTTRKRTNSKPGSEPRWKTPPLNSGQPPRGTEESSTDDEAKHLNEESDCESLVETPKLGRSSRCSQSSTSGSSVASSSSAHCLERHSRPSQDTNESSSEAHFSDSDTGSSRDSDMMTSSSGTGPSIPAAPLPPLFVNMPPRLYVFLPRIPLNQCALGEIGNLTFCIEGFAYDFFSSVMTLKEPCVDTARTGARCEHSTIQGLMGLPVTESLPRILPILTTQVHTGWKHGFGDVDPLSQFTLSLVNTCSRPCNHTKISLGGTKCMLTTHFKAALGFPTSDNAFRFTEPESSGVSREAGGRYVSMRSLGFDSSTCFFCGREALEPRFQGTFSTSLVVYASVAYGYTCSRCNTKTWITGTRWAWESTPH